MERIHFNIAELLAESPCDGPERFASVDFERFAARLAVHWLNHPNGAELLITMDERAANPVFVANEFKSMLIFAAPQYFSTFETPGKPHDGEYRIIGTVPKQAIIDAAVKAQILQPPDDP